MRTERSSHLSIKMADIRNLKMTSVSDSLCFFPSHEFLIGVKDGSSQTSNLQNPCSSYVYLFSETRFLVTLQNSNLRYKFDTSAE